MAIMWPRELPTWVAQDPRRSSEIQVFNKLKALLTDEWSVYYSRPWWGLSYSGGELDGEADFVLAHPQFGVLFIEVKGGQVIYEPTTSKWTSRDRYGVVHRIKDPVQQALKSKHILLKKFQDQGDWPTRRVRLGHGVLLTDSDSPREGLIAGYEQELFCFATQFRDKLDQWILSRLDVARADQVGPGTAGIRAIDATIAAPAKLRVPLHRELDGDIAAQDVLLTGAQLQALAFIDTRPRVVIEGGAGTGKTVLACEFSRRRANDGKQVLLCCVNESLVVSLRDKCGSDTSLEVCSVKKLIEENLDVNGRLFDVVVIDEGQDVDWEDWDSLENLLSHDGELKVFFDGNQAIYRARSDLETKLNASFISLSLNLRNTRSIANVTDGLYRGPLVQCVGPKGKPVNIINTERVTEEAIAVIRDLVECEHIPLRDIAVLSEDSYYQRTLASQLFSIGIKSSSAISRESNSLIIDSIVNFKGLEALVVIVLANYKMAKNTEFAYVAVSRARVLLVVIGRISGTILEKALIEAKQLTS
jgi:hypothetical protein